jgi:hypothetical protein
MEEKKLTLSLTVNEINVILASLGKQPYESVFTVVESIRTQVINQQNKENADKN